VYLWRKKAKVDWVETHEEILQTGALGQLVIVHRPGRKHLELEIVCRSRSESSVLLKKFGGRVENVPADWLARIAREQSKPIKIGRRLVVARSVKQARHAGRRMSQRSSRRRARADAVRMKNAGGARIKPALLVIPASLAFGTGEHATTAMSLRLLEQLTRCWKPGWRFVDLGTGSGILALAAKRFGAGPVIAIDNDPSALTVAKSNARLNRIRGVAFRLADVRKWDFPQEADALAANLYSELLVEILPKLGGKGWLIVTGVLRSQQNELMRELRRNHFNIHAVKCRGKWIAVMGRTKPGRLPGPTWRR
jgi:ribosomal protein L11 methyltransferase